MSKYARYFRGGLQPERILRSSGYNNLMSSSLRNNCSTPKVKTFTAPSDNFFRSPFSKSSIPDSSQNSDSYSPSTVYNLINATLHKLSFNSQMDVVQQQIIKNSFDSVLKYLQDVNKGLTLNEAQSVVSFN
ncbi:hypothetical protein PUN28_008814 [Cardiocondyla obscurior]|uniref:Uncharacterized protein n=1 Tax=Cardiocondyla obscurior TaxID=286306 RepID=A0AAW2FQH4_9HYME